MLMNADKPHLWKADVDRSIDFYNDWFLRFAPETYRTQRRVTTQAVLDAFHKTENLTQISPLQLREVPGLLPILRMATAPPLARDRLMGLAHVGKALIDALEAKSDLTPRLPVRTPKNELQEGMQRVCDILVELIDVDLLPWVVPDTNAKRQELTRAATVIADRMCGALSDPIIRNAQEQRQLAALKRWMKKNGYKEYKAPAGREARDPYKMPPGTFAFRIPLEGGFGASLVKIPIDCAIRLHASGPLDLPVLIEAKSAGDATNTNKRRKEEAQKYRQLKERYGESVKFILYLCGYFEPGYLGYEAAEGIDWVWEHRTSDFETLLGVSRSGKTSASREDSPEYSASTAASGEVVRAASQLAVDSSKSPEERNRLGQFSTPYPLALQMVKLALQWHSRETDGSFLEPAAGTGVFFSALLGSGQKGRFRTAIGCEVDDMYGDIARRIWGPQGFDVETRDFLDFARTPANFGKFTLLCTNPPYVRHHHLASSFKTCLQAAVMQRLGLQPSGLSGLYVYFILMADALLADGAIASWLLPAEFLYVNYGRVIREYLTSRVSVLSIHHFDPDEVQFDDALVSSCVVTYCKKAPSNDSVCTVSFGGELETSRQIRTVSLAKLRSHPKWTIAHFDNLGATSKTGVRLKDFFSVRRGIATGANNYFMIDADTVHKYEIPNAFLKPILPSPRYLKDTIIEACPDGRPRVDGFRFLLDCTLTPDEVKRTHPGLWAYLEEGRARRLPERYLCAQREVWYYQERREPALFLASYMGRTNGGCGCPIRFFVNFSSAIATNVFLNLYPSNGLIRILHGNRERIIEFAEVLNSLPASTVLQEGRSYGGGLHKIEPKELLEVQIESPPDWLLEGTGLQLQLV